MDKREVRFHLHWTDLKFLGKCNVHKRAIMADITPILWFLICHYHRPDHLGWVLFEVVADLPHVLLTIARRVRTLAGEKCHYAALDHLASPSKRFLKRHITTSQLWSQLDNGHNPESWCHLYCGRDRWGRLSSVTSGHRPEKIVVTWGLLWKWLVWLKPNFLSSGDATNLVDGKSLKYPPRKSDAHKLALSPRVDIIASHQQ